MIYKGENLCHRLIKLRRHHAAHIHIGIEHIPQADVVITNPTHYAVAIKYDPQVYDAPYVIAKGADYLAQKIRETP